MRTPLTTIALFAAFCLPCIPHTIVADTIVYASFSGLGTGNAQTNTTLNMQVGDTASGSIWIFTDSDDIDVAATGSVLLSNSTTAAFTSAVVVNPLINNATFSTRWSETDNGNISSTGNAIANMSGFSGNPNTSGILLSQGFGDPGPVFDDAGFDNSPGTMSYLYATFTVEAIGIGSVVVAPDSFLLSSDGLVDFTTADATINVVPIPEPGIGFAVVLCVGLAINIRRRRTN